MLTSGSSQGGLLELGISLVMQDRFSNPAREASSKLRRLHQEAKMAVEANLQAAEQGGNGIAQAGKQMFNVMGQALDEGLAYSDTMITVQAITEATADQMKVTSDLAKRIGVATTFSAKEVASGMQYLAMAGADIEEVQDMIEAATNLAGATNMAIGGKGGAADLMTNVMKTFRHEGKDAATFVADVLTNATLSANISMTDLAESIKYVGADAVLMKRTLPEVAAAIGTLGNAGIQGSMAGTALGNALRYLNRAMNRPNSYGASWLAKIGLQKDQLLDSTGKLKNLGEVFTMLSERIEGMSPDQQLQLMSDVFGVRGMRAAGAMVSALKDYKRLYTDILLKSEGYAEDIMQKRMEGPAGRYDMMWESIKTAAISWVEAAQPVLVSMFDMVTNFFTLVSNFFDSGIGRFTARIMALAPPITLIGGLLIKWTSRWRQTQNDTLVTGKSMFRILFSGWKGMTAAAMDYERILIQIKALQAGLAKDLNMPFDLLSMSKKQRSRVYDQILRYQAPESQYKKQIGNTIYTANRTDDGRYILYQREVGYRKPPKKLGDYQASDVNKRLSKQLGIPDDPLASDKLSTGSRASGSSKRVAGPIFSYFRPYDWGKKYPTFGKDNSQYDEALFKEARKNRLNMRPFITISNNTGQLNKGFTSFFNLFKKRKPGSSTMSVEEALYEMKQSSSGISGVASATGRAASGASKAATAASNATNMMAGTAQNIASATQSLNNAARLAIMRQAGMMPVMVNTGKVSTAGKAVSTAAKGKGIKAWILMAGATIGRTIKGIFKKGILRHGILQGLKFIGLKVIPKILGTIVGFLGGPVGIIIGLLAFLPDIIGLFKKNNDDTSEMKDNVKKIDTTLNRNNPDDPSYLNYMSQEQKLTALLNAIKDWSKILQEGLQDHYKSTIIVNVEGKKAMEQLLDNRDKVFNIDLGAPAGV